MSTTTRKSASPSVREADDLIRELMEKTGCSRAAAASKVFAAHPGLREKMISEANRKP